MYSPNTYLDETGKRSQRPVKGFLHSMGVEFSSMGKSEIHKRLSIPET
jgi:hypothetical protein